MPFTRDQVTAAIAMERQLVEILETEAKAGVFASIKEAHIAWVASQGRLAALQQVLDQIDQKTGKADD